MLGILNFLIYLVIMICIYSLMTLALNLHYGFSGLIDFGLVGFFCVGAYTSALLGIQRVPAPPFLTAYPSLPFPVCLILAGVVAAVVGIAFSAPTAKLGVHYWAIVTLGGAEIIRVFILNEEWLTRGSYGIPTIPRPLSTLIPADYYPPFYLSITIIILIGVYFLIEKLVNSPYGRIIKAMRDGEALPQSLGVNLNYYKVVTMALGAGIAGIAGSLYAHYITYVSPFDFMPDVTFLVWTMLICGGVGNNLGSIIGTATVTALYSSSRFVKDYIPLSADTVAYIRMMAIGILLLVILIYRRGGLLREQKRKFIVKNETIGKHHARD